VHGIGGIWGALATGLFADTSVNGIGSDGLFFGNPDQFVKQLVATAAAVLFAGSATFVILKLIDLTIGLRVPEQEEVLGLDSSQHGELAYRL
jgi:Amt family ammonium transporter